MKSLNISFVKNKADMRMKCPKCLRKVGKVFAVPDGEDGHTIWSCHDCLRGLVACYGYSRSQVIRYTKLAELNRDLEKEIENSGLCNNDFEPCEQVFDEIPTRCPLCGYNWPILTPFRIHDTKKCRKKHCPRCGGHVVSVPREVFSHQIRRVSPFDGDVYIIPATATAANSIGPDR